MAKTPMTTRHNQALIAIGTDHRGYRLKSYVAGVLEKDGYRVVDVGTNTGKPVDYPDVAKKVTKLVTRQGAKGILICSTGIGMEIAANKVKGIRAANAWTPSIAAKGRHEDNTNILCLPNDTLSHAQALRIVRAWLTASFGEHPRYRRRQAKLSSMEKQWRA